MSGYYEGKSIEKMSIKDLRIVLDKAKVGHAQIKLKKDLIAAVGRLPPRPGDTTAEDAAAAAAADAAAAAAAEAAAAAAAEATVAAAAEAAAAAALAGAGEEDGGDGAPTNEAFNQMLEGLTQGLTQHTKGLQGSIQDLGSSILADRQYEKGSSSIVDPTRARELTALRAGLLDTWAGGSSGSGSGCRRHLLGDTASVTFPLVSSDGERDQYMTFVWSVQGYLSKGVNEMKMFMSPAVVQRVLLLDPDSDAARRSTPLASVQRDLDDPLTVDQQAVATRLVARICGTCFSGMYGTAADYTDRLIFIDGKIVEFKRRHALGRPWMSDVCYDVVFQRAVQHQYAKHWCADESRALLDMGCIPHDNLLLDAAVAVDEALSARRPAGKRAASADDCEEAKAKSSRKPRAQSLAVWDDLSEAKQISLGIQEDKNGLLRRDVCIRWWMGVCDKDQSHTVGQGVAHSQVNHGACIVKACRHRHTASESAPCKRVVETVKELGRY